MVITAEQFKLITLVAFTTLISGVADAYGFLHAAKIWQENRLLWLEVGLSALGFSLGISMYWLMLKYLQQLGVNAPEIQTAFWFTVTIIGVAVGSGAFFKWDLREQGVALAVVVGIGWLLVKTGEL